PGNVALSADQRGFNTFPPPSRQAPGLVQFGERGTAAGANRFNPGTGAGAGFASGNGRKSCEGARFGGRTRGRCRTVTKRVWNSTGGETRSTWPPASTLLASMTWRCTPAGATSPKNSGGTIISVAV